MDRLFLISIFKKNANTIKNSIGYSIHVFVLKSKLVSNSLSVVLIKKCIFLLKVESNLLPDLFGKSWMIF